MYMRHGFGDSDSDGPSTAQVAGAASGFANSIASAIQSNAPLSTKIESAAAGALFSAAAIPSPATPFLAIAGGIASLLATVGVGSGCGQTCVLSSNYANQAEALLQQNVNAYLALPQPRSTIDQQAALANFNAIWQDLVQQCSNPQLGDAGRRCISDRQAGACTWRNNGQCWNWFSGYRDPIANDTDTYAPSIASDASGAAASLFGGGNNGILLALAAAAVIAAVVL